MCYKLCVMMLLCALCRLLPCLLCKINCNSPKALCIVVVKTEVPVFLVH